VSQERIGALFVGPAPFFSSRRDQIIALAASHAIPALYVRREFAADGGLMSCGTSLPNIYRQTRRITDDLNGTRLESPGLVMTAMSVWQSR
jgi:hypothetical protein